MTLNSTVELPHARLGCSLDLAASPSSSVSSTRSLVHTIAQKNSFDEIIVHIQNPISVLASMPIQALVLSQLILPSSCSVGIGAGATAAVMAQKNWTSAEALENVAVIQSVLSQSNIAQPLSWD